MYVPPYMVPTAYVHSGVHDVHVSLLSYVCSFNMAGKWVRTHMLTFELYISQIIWEFSCICVPHGPSGEKMDR